jgi:hypothetical protein
VSFIPVYIQRAQAAAKEMRALRARLDYAMERAALLKVRACCGGAQRGASAAPSE